MVTVGVCIGTTCHLQGAYNVVQTFIQMIEENEVHDKVDIDLQFCMKKCENKGVAVSINDQKFSITPENARTFFEDNVMAII